MRTAAAYIRVSTDSQIEYSPDSQLRLIRDYAKRNALILPDEYIYADEGISGRKADKRPQFQKMLFDGKRKAFEVILIYHTSRFARNHEESIIYRSMLKREGIEVVSITQPNIDEKTDLLMNALYAAMDERYSLDLSENVKRGMSEKAMRGETVNSVPYGYKILIPREVPQVVEAEAGIVRMIFDEYIHQNTPVRSIAIKLNSMGVLSPRGKLWTRERVDLILRNNFYCGYTRYNIRYSDTKKLRPETEHIIRKGRHTPIITEELYNAAVEKANKRQKFSKPANVKVHWLSGILKCEACGGGLNVVRGSSKDKKPFLRCRNYIFGKCEETQYTPAVVLEGYLLDNMQEVLRNPYEALYEPPKGESEKDIRKEINTAIERSEQKLLRVKAAYEAGVDTILEYSDNKRKIQMEIETLRCRLSEMESTALLKLTDKAEAKVIQAVNSVIAAVSSSADTQTKYEAVASVISRIVYSKKKRVFRVYYFYR